MHIDDSEECDGADLIIIRLKLAVCDNEELQDHINDHNNTIDDTYRYGNVPPRILDRLQLKDAFNLTDEEEVEEYEANVDECEYNGPDLLITLVNRYGVAEA